MTTIGVMYPEMPPALGPVVPYADACLAGGHRLWFGHSTIVDSMMTMAALAGRGYPLPFGSAVALFPITHPQGHAVAATAVARLTGQTYIAGVGPGSTEFQQKALGATLPTPVTSAGEFVDEMKKYIPRPMLTAPDHRRDEVDARYGSVETGLGVLRPAMARCTGRHAEWAITWLTPGAYVRDHLAPEMRTAAAAAGRQTPGIAAVVHAAIRRPGRDPVALAHAAVGAHLSAPHYTSMLRQAGLDVDASDPLAGAARLVESGTYLYGTGAEIAQGIADLHAAGVDEVIVNVFGVSRSISAGDAVDDLGEILDATRSTVAVTPHTIPAAPVRELTGARA